MNELSVDFYAIDVALLFFCVRWNALRKFSTNLEDCTTYNASMGCSHNQTSNDWDYGVPFLVLKVKRFEDVEAVTEGGREGTFSVVLFCLIFLSVDAHLMFLF